MRKFTKYALLTALMISISGCSSKPYLEEFPQVSTQVPTQENTQENLENSDNLSEQKEDYTLNQEKVQSKPSEQSSLGKPDTTNHKLIVADGGDTNGYRQPNVVVNIGFGDREYWSYTNEHGQLVRVTAEKIILQDEKNESVNSSGRYYSAMANVPGVGQKHGYDRGHVIADSLGGVANAYNITPQNATLNRHGDQAYMERNIRQAGGATNLEAIITYPNTETQIPSHYQFTYTIKGNTVVDKFANDDPEITNAKNNNAKNTKPNVNKPQPSKSIDSNDNQPPNIAVGDVSAVDLDNNGRVTVAEAKKAGFSMPIYSDHWLYPYMHDANNNGMVGE